MSVEHDDAIEAEIDAQEARTHEAARDRSRDGARCKHAEPEALGSVQAFTNGGRQCWRALFWCEACGAIAETTEGARRIRRKEWRTPTGSR